MAQGLISAKYLYDIAEAIRVKSGSQSTIKPAQMAAAIANIDGSISGSITPSADTGAGLITDTILTSIANAIRTKLDVQTQYTPAHMADAILSITGGGGGVTIVPWSTGTDAEIGDMIDAAHAGTIDLQQDGGWAVGDVRSITISAFTGGGNTSHASQTIDIVISSFSDYNSCGCVMQFDFKDELATGVRMNSSHTNAGGYGASEMKLTTLPALVNALPTWLKNALIEFSVLASAGSKSSTIETVTGNKLALRSEVEIFGSTTFSKAGEGSQIPYYATSANRIKKRGHSGSANSWWERSPLGSNSNRFCNVDSYGGANGNGASNAYGVAPFGCL